MKTADRQIKRILGRGGTARSWELVAAGISRSEISRRVAAGTLVRVARGLYALPDYEGGEHAAMVEVAQLHPGWCFVC